MGPSRCVALLRLLADGERHSGERLAGALGISRAAVWKRVRGLERLGVEVDAVRGGGYRLRQPVELLDRRRLMTHLEAPLLRVIEQLDVFEEIDSTNGFLLVGRRPEPGKFAVCLAEFQRGGRGRRGRSWLTPFGGGLCLSIGWTFPTPPEDLAALALAAGVVTRRVLIGHARLAVAIKWPNDLLVDGKKLGGLLVEVAAESHGPCYVVIGVGLNVSATPDLPSGPGAWPGGAIDLATATGEPAPSRNALAGALVAALSDLLHRYAVAGFADYRAELADADYLYGRSVEAEGIANPVAGRGAGVGPDGALLLETPNGMTKVISGEVSVRPVA